MGLSWKTIVLGLVVIALAVWIFGIDLPGEQRQIEQQAEAAVLLPIDPAVVDTLRIERAGLRTTIVRGDGGWRITEPIDEPAERRTVESVIERLTSATSARTVSDAMGEDQWFAYGLERGQAGRVDVVLASDTGARAVLSVGNLIPAGADYVYVRRGGSDALELAEQAVFDLANATHHGYRKVDLFAISDDDIVQLQFDGPGGRWIARRDTTTGLWYDLAADGATRLKRWEMDDIALAVGEQRVQAYLRDELRESDWAAYGLDAPWAEITVTTKDGRSQQLWLGNEDMQRQYYGRRDGLDTVFLLRPQFLAALDEGTEFLEDFNPLPRNLRRATAFRIEDAEGRWAELRPGTDDAWELWTEDGRVSSTSFRQTAADNVARGLEEMQPERSIYLPSGADPLTLLDERAGRAVIRFENGVLELDFGWRDGDDGFWFSTQGDPALYELPRGMFLRLRSFVDALHRDDDAS